MFKKSLWISLLMMAAVLLASCASTAQAQTGEADVSEPRTISVNGFGTINLAPDLARISIGVHTENRDANEAVAENNAQATAVQDALLDMGVEERDVNTSNFSIYPQQEWNNDGERTGTTYVVDNTVNVTVRDLDAIGELLEAAIGAGANNIYGITFDVADRETARQEAMGLAVENARARAETLAEAAGVGVGEVQSISTFVNVSPPSPYRSYDMAVEEAVGGGAVPISSGEMTINVEVTVIYGIQ